MFNQGQENEGIQSFSYLPSATVKIPVSQPVAALLLHLFNRPIGAVNIGIEDMKVEGANLVITSLINKGNQERKHELFGIYENNELKNLKELMNQMIEEKFEQNDQEVLEYYRQKNEEENDEIEEDGEIDWEAYWEENWGNDKALYF